MTIDLGNAASIRESFAVLAEKARQYGLLSLEDDIGTAKDLFGRLGLQLVIDGTDPTIIRSILSIEVETFEIGEKQRIREETLRMERELAIAIATKRMMLEGCLSLQAGDNPRIIEVKLDAFRKSSLFS